MFALLVGPHAADMASAMVEGMEGFRRSKEARGHAAALVRPPDLLPEDRFDPQPIVDDGSIFVCKARIDRRADLAGRLNLAPQRARVMADSQLLHLGWRRWFETCAQEVSGDYSYAAYDPIKECVHAAVDHWGGAAGLFWARTPAGLVLADNLALLLRHPEVDRTLGRAELVGFTQSGIDRESTPYPAIRAVPGGHRLFWAGGQVKVERWWKPVTTPRFGQDPLSVVEEARALLRQATCERMRSSGKVAATLSGGMDSGIVTALAASAHPDTPMLAYTGVPEPGLEVICRAGWEANDGPAAAQTAALYPNIVHRLTSVGSRSWPQLISRINRDSALPVRGSANLLWLDEISRQARADGARVLLTGQHGNFSLSHSGDGALLELAARRQWRSALRLLGAGGSPWAQARMLKRYAAAQWRHRPGRPPAAPSQDFLLPEARALAQPSFLFRDRPFTRANWLRFATAAPHYWRCDAAERWGLDWRDPTADRRFLEWILQLPLAAFRMDGRDRGLAREIGRGLLPEPVRLRTARGAQSADAAAWIRRDRIAFGQLLAVIAGSETARAMLNLPHLQHCFARILSDDAGASDVAQWLQALTLGDFLAQTEHIQ
ncbi:asparagine synthase-related protein [Sphingomonas sp.]|jgi:asparagine synthase (glutamine-hydrolysing)|uniref:asparagine synthase-related protein n=1 Tax=Sphingomonas sp. TaxID=28214 RepID=UPI002E103F02|nr:asparagine synthase-related protein [Sphingomonas sp.]HEV7286994.1 asparagine synthase-related protein [Sphingomonas sp.]